MDITQFIIFIIGVIVLPLLFTKIIDINASKKRPIYAFFVAIFFVLIGFIAAFFVFSSMLSIVMITFSSLFILPFVIKVLAPVKGREKNKLCFYDWFTLKNLEEIMKKYDNMIRFYVFAFFGIAFAYTFLFTILGNNTVEAAFSHQLGLFTPGEFNLSFFDIVENNLQVLILSFMFSIFYGAGSIFILNYNASIVGVVYGTALRAFFWQVPVVFNILTFIPHTVLEVLAYLLAAVAGGILSQSRNYRDAFIILAISILLLLVAGYAEVIFLNV